MILRDLRRSAIAVLVLTGVFGFAYPALLTAFAQLAFSNKADGSLVELDGRVVGSKLAAQGFTTSRYFHSRPSATVPAYDASATTFSNLGPTNDQLARDVKARAEAILQRERPYNPRLTLSDVPVDAVTTSGSGIDPEISPAYALLQAPRVAAVRHLPVSRVDALVTRHTRGRSFGFLGEPGVNVLELNLALDRAGA